MLRHSIYSLFSQYKKIRVLVSEEVMLKKLSLKLNSKDFVIFLGPKSEIFDLTAKPNFLIQKRHNGDLINKMHLLAF